MKTKRYTVSFVYKIIAQELEAVFPALVSSQKVDFSKTGKGGEHKVEIDANGEIINTDKLNQPVG